MNELSYPKVLIISHNLYDTSNNIGKTLVSLFNGWPKDRLAQLYFRNDIPSFNYCNQYYCITDKDVLKSAITFGIRKSGAIVNSKRALKLSATEANLYQVGNHRKPLISLCRDVIWDIADWKSSELTDWLINEVNPDSILFVPNDYTLAYKVALYVCDIVKKPIIPFYMDDAFYWNCKSSLVDSFRRMQLRKLARKIHTKANKLFTICDYMSTEYEQLFHMPCEAFVNSVKIENLCRKRAGNGFIVSYLGNLHSNRWKSIVEVGKAIDQINNEYEINVEFRIYSASMLEPSVRREFEVTKSINFLGCIPPDVVREKQLESDVLLHVEAFDRQSVNSTRLSLSTKIPEYLSTGVCVFAYGPDNISSMKYLSDFNLAQVCNSVDDLKDKMKQIIMDKELREKFSRSGFERALNNHNIDVISNKFQKLIMEMSAEK